MIKLMARSLARRMVNNVMIKDFLVCCMGLPTDEDIAEVCWVCTISLRAAQAMTALLFQDTGSLAENVINRKYRCELPEKYALGVKGEGGLGSTFGKPCSIVCKCLYSPGAGRIFLYLRKIRNRLGAIAIENLASWNMASLDAGNCEALIRDSFSSLRVFRFYPG